MTSPFQTPTKQLQPITKQQKSHNQSRQGDWVCINCNNLNFSFRKKCNRCKTQTRKQNEDMQNAYNFYYYNQQNVTPEMWDYEERHQQNQQQNNFQMNYDVQLEENTQLNENYEILEDDLSFSKITLVQQDISPAKILNNSQQKVELCNSKKLRTPSTKKKCGKNFINQLPSVSPLLKKLLLAKEDTNLSKKDKLTVALFYDQVWDSNKQNQSVSSSLCFDSIQCKDSKINWQSCTKKALQSSHLHRTNDSLTYQLSNEKQQQKFEVICIDEDDQQLAQIINRIII